MSIYEHDDCTRTEDEVFIVVAYHDAEPVVIGVFNRHDLVTSAMHGYADDFQRLHGQTDRGLILAFTVHPAAFNQHGLAPATEHWLLNGQDIVMNKINPCMGRMLRYPLQGKESSAPDKATTKGGPRRA